ncbi:hypothetical protein [uncultured Friedmanniella sp.]|uniref:hypothetical protein n=1 Tax=uncultured Friedmanniella sp. TaxID=335381 RepID=UPI0035CAFB2C
MTALERSTASLRRLVAAQTRRLPRGRPTLAPRRPRVTVETGAWLPGWLLRLVCVALAVGCVRLAGAGDTLTVLGVVLAALVLVRPGGVGPVVVLAFTAFVLTVSSDGGWRPESNLLLLGAHLLVQLGALLGRSSWAVRVELRALLVPAPRFVAVQLTAQLVAVLGAAVTGRFELPGLAVLAAVGLAALVLFLTPRLTARP